MSSIESALKEDGIYIGDVAGDSMMPMLRQGIDKVIIMPPIFPLKKYDVPLYRRDDHYTLHRIVAVKNSGYVIRGDNRVFNEYDITENDIVGVLKGIIRDGRVIEYGSKEYFSFAKKASRSYPIRKIMRRIRLKRGVRA